MNPTGLAATSSAVPTARSLFKNILHGSGLYSIAQLLPTATSLLLVPITTRYLTRSDYGIQDLLSQVSMVISALLGWYFSLALGFFYFEAEPEGRHRVVGTTVIGSTMLGVIACLICYPAAGLLSSAVFPHLNAAPYLKLVFLMMPPSFAGDALLTWLRVANKPVMYVAACVMRAVTTVVCTIWFVGLLKMHVWGVLYSTTASFSLTVLLLGAYWLLQERVAFDLGLFWRIARYAMPLGLSGLAMFVLHFGDSFILPHFRPYDDLGIYRLAYKIAMLVSLVYGAFGTYWNAQVFNIMRREDADTVFARLFTYVMLVISYFSVALIAGARPTLHVIAGPAFQGAAALVPVLVIAYYLRSISEFMRSLFLAAGRPGLDAAAAWAGAAVCIGGYAALIPKFGIWGAAYATLIAFGALAVISIVWAYRVQPYRVEGARLAKVGIAWAAAVGAWALIPAASFSAQALSAGISLAVFPAVLGILRFVTPGELETARAGVQRASRVARSVLGTLRAQASTI